MDARWDERRLSGDGMRDPELERVEGFNVYEKHPGDREG